MKKILRFSLLFWALAGFLLIGVVAPGQAALMLQDRGNITFDPNTGLRWLDLTQTEGLSPSSALALFPDFRYATQSEVLGLFSSAGFSMPFGPSKPEELDEAQALIDLLGLTFVGTRTFGSQGFAVFESLPSHFANPFVAVVDGTSGRVFTGHIVADANRAVGDVGVYLVQEIPEPSTLFLFSITLVGLGVLMRRRSQ